MNQICAKYNALVSSVGQPSGTLEQQAGTARRINAITRTENAAVRKVSPPPGDEQRLRDMLDEVNRGLEAADESSRLILTDAKTANQRAAQGFTLLGDANRKFATYGLTTCAQ